MVKGTAIGSALRHDLGRSCPSAPTLARCSAKEDILAEIAECSWSRGVQLVTALEQRNAAWVAELLDVADALFLSDLCRPSGGQPPYHSRRSNGHLLWHYRSLDGACRPTNFGRAVEKQLRQLASALPSLPTKVCPFPCPCPLRMAWYQSQLRQPKL